HCHFPCGELGDEALAVARESWALTAGFLGQSQDGVRRSADGPATLHLYGSWEDYLAEEDRLAGGTFRETGAFASRDDRAAHVLVPGELSAALGRIPGHHRRTIAHEAAHLASYDLARGAFWPPWLAEGLAGWAERRLALDDAAFAGRRDDPWASTHLWRVQRMMELGTLPGVEATFSGAPVELSLPDAYAFWIELFHFLAQGSYGERIQEVVRAVASQEIPAARAWPAVGEIVQETLSPQEMAAMEEEFRAYLSGGALGWVELFRSLEEEDARPGSWIQYAIVEAQVGSFAWRAAEPAPTRGFRLTVQVEPTPVNPEADPWEVRVALGTRGGDPLLVALDGEGGIHLRSFPPNPLGTLETLASRARSPRPDPASEPEPITMEVRFEPGEVAVRVLGEAPVVFPAPGLSPSGLWGPGVAPGTLARWRGWRVSPLAPAASEGPSAP
ncbi:MAG: hypothetical protein EA422_11465, partial [Gemmatimonadales bacterium]